MTDALTKLLPLIEAAMQQYAHSASAVERVIRALRYGLRTAGKHGASGSLVSTLMTAIPRWFSVAPHCSYLYLTSELVKIFGADAQQEAPLGENMLCLTLAHTMRPTPHVSQLVFICITDLKMRTSP